MSAPEASRLAGRTAIVTGARHGVSRSIGLRLSVLVIDGGVWMAP